MVGFPTDQHIHRPVPAGQVDQHRAVMVPRRSANSSTPSTVTRPTGGSGSPRINRSSVDRLTAMPNVAANRDPARPASANPTATSAPAGRRCGGRAARSTPVPARRKCLQNSRRGRRRTAAPSTTHHRPPRNGKISHPPPIAAVHPRRYPPAPAATRPTRPRMRGDNHRVIDPSMPIDHHRRQMRKQNPATIFKSHRPRAPRPRTSGQPGPASRNVCQNHMCGRPKVGGVDSSSLSAWCSCCIRH